VGPRRAAGKLLGQLQLGLLTELNVERKRKRRENARSIRALEVYQRPWRVVWRRWRSVAMTSASRLPSLTPSTRQNQTQTARRRRDRLRHIHPLTREQQMALIAEARAARLAAAGEQPPETRQ
jgi:hypothetical protein